jgi:hypothetical protein
MVMNGDTWAIMPGEYQHQLPGGSSWGVVGRGVVGRGWVSVGFDDGWNEPVGLLIQMGADSLALALLDGHFRQEPNSRVVKLPLVADVRSSEGLFHRMANSNDESSDQERRLDAECFDMVYWCRAISRLADEMRLEVVRTGRVKWAYDYNFGFFLRSARADQKLFESIPSFRVPAVAADLGEMLAFILRFQYFTDFRGALCTTIERFVRAWPTAYGPLASGALGVLVPDIEDDGNENRGRKKTTVDIREFLKLLAESKDDQSAED